MAPPTKPNTKGNQAAKVPRLKLSLKAQPKAQPKATSKVSDEVFLLTLLKGIKVDHEAAAAALGIKKPASRMRYTRLQQKYGFKAVGQREKEAPANNADVTEGGAEEKTA
ncbi:hypothetical protein E8E15_002165 [Penicillium rubens]|uniref:uncharacterized protein n=1 Tax=Penicillium rubens TaxID=1108849 RepID=UPI001E067681|nr:uncharacterized protein N7525_010988 [Penicillium rubens]KAJ5285669.1 hypothetical protein N7524_000975 [Penicillium chrysogenum]KAF3028347.1 hypothetical protein E8E15_002165 [Penicillium rubens]KAJ5036649.1 hypothetical protein NUH16_004524 [Penicillium rubens]KAJ5821704.1 hypothetical protein N7525_010988 [Penicillium rubens]KAJ5859352.1 hypothetical protein N7534_004629 [Penicillium rubens]